MSSITIFEANRDTRNEAEAAALVLEHAREHLLNHEPTPIASAVADLRACALLADLSLLVFPDQDFQPRRGGL